MIFFVGKDRKRSVELFRENYAHQLVGKSHFGKGEL